MTAFQGIFLSAGTPEGRGSQPQDTPCRPRRSKSPRKSPPEAKAAPGSHN